DITDINGETRSGEIIVPISYKSIQLKINITEGEPLPVDSLKHLSISTRNLNGEFVAVMAHVVIHKLSAPERLIRQRYWTQPDQFVMSEEEYLNLFPYDEYQDEKSPNSWSGPIKAYDHTGLTTSNNGFGIQPGKFTPGWYSIEVSAKDSSGGEVKDIKYIQLFDEQSNKLPFTNYSWSMQKNTIVEPGEKSTITIGSSAKDLYIIQQIDKKASPPTSRAAEKDKKDTDYNFISLNNESKSFDFPVTENDRGGFSVHHFFVKNNRFYSITNQVNVPWTNKELSISYETFRDKTLPGSEEKWKLQIRGSKNEKVAAEMLASMYDASLDQFQPHSWTVPYVWPIYSGLGGWNGLYNFSAVQSQETYREADNSIKYYADEYDQILSFPDRNRIMIRGMASVRAPAPGQVSDMLSGTAGGMEVSKSAKVADSEKGRLEEVLVVGYGNKPPVQNASTIQIRKNFNETAFFLPDLKTDSAGNISFGFTIPEALTRWKFQAISHTKEAAFGYSTKDIITQKQLMVQPNAPRFLREGDKLELSTKIVNMTDKELTGTVHLELLNAADMKPVDGLFQNMNANQYFTAGAGKSVSAKFSVQVPYQFNGAVVYRFVAKSSAATISDGEEAPLPVLTNSMLVTESLPLNLRGTNTKNFRFEKLLQSGSSETLQQHSLTVEFTSNPAWYAVQALPYLIEYPYECSEQTFNRFYANALASKIANGSPRLKSIFQKWKSAGEKEGGLVSNLQKNPELKAVLLEETPWVLEAKSELQQQKNIALLFDMVRMSGEIESTVSKLQQLQLSNGGFSWFKGGPDDRFITQYILTGIGHLKKLNVTMPAKLNDVIRLAISYLDKRLKEDYDKLIKSKSDLRNNNTGYQHVQYLYMRSFFSEYGIAGETVKAASYYRKQTQQFWLQQNRFMQGMIALSLD
ncbi:MAG: alpha-2-macroglobulin family protein, partial [Dyadobacter sp.]